MRKHGRATSLIRLLAQFGWQRDQELWTVLCRDGHGRRAHLHIHLDENGVTLAASSPGPWTFTPSQAGQLRGAVRDALFSFDRLAGNRDGRCSSRAQTEEPLLPQRSPDPIPASKFFGRHPGTGSRICFFDDIPLGGQS